MLATVVELTNSVGLLLSLCLAYWLIVRAANGAPLHRSIAAGVLFGLVGVVGMAIPLQLAPGVFFDPRTVVVSVGGALAGPVAGAIAAAPVIFYRYTIGGSGVVVGITTIVVSFACGAAYHLLKKGARPRAFPDLFVLGAVVHGLAIAAFGLLPEPSRSATFASVAVPFLVTLTIATPAMGLLLLEIERSVETERALKDRDARLAAMLAALPDLLMLIDEDGLCLEAHTGNDEPLYDLARSIVGQDVTTALGHDTGILTLSAVSRCIATNSIQQITFPIDLAGGRHWLQARVVPVDGRINGRRIAVALSRDMSELLASQANLIKARDQAERASRIKSEFLANMSHDLRTPLNAIMGFADVMRMEVMGPIGNDAYRGYVEDIHMSGELLVNLINDVLDVSKIEAGQYRLDDRVHDISELIEGILGHFRSHAETKQLTFRSSCVRNGFRAQVDSRAMTQVLTNVLANAVRYTDPGGVIEIDCRRGIGGGLDIVVADTGIGITEDILDQLEAPFLQHHSLLARKQQGTGLGLYIARQLMALHGGGISIDSRVGAGTRVTLTLPEERVFGQGERPASAAASVPVLTVGEAPSPDQLPPDRLPPDRLASADWPHRDDPA